MSNELKVLKTKEVNTYKFLADGKEYIVRNHRFSILPRELCAYDEVLLSINNGNYHNVTGLLKDLPDVIRCVGDNTADDYVIKVGGGVVASNNVGELIVKALLVLDKDNTLLADKVDPTKCIVNFYTKGGDRIYIANTTPVELLGILTLMEDVYMRVDSETYNVTTQLLSILNKLQLGELTLSYNELMKRFSVAITCENGATTIDPYVALYEYIQRENLGTGVISYISFEVFKRDTFLTVSVIDVEKFDDEKATINNKLTDTYIMLANLYLEFPSDSHPFDNLNQKVNLLSDIFNTITERQIKGVLMVDTYKYYDYDIKVTVKR